jgi:trans-aconitate methyltransferase
VSEQRFDAAWLGLREPADAAARCADLVSSVRAQLTGPIVVHDLGSGTGSMARWVSQLLPQARWVLHDHDPELLALAPDGVGRRVGDLAELTADDLADAGLVTASALLDVLTAAEVEAIAAACARRRVPALLTLTVVGRVELDPPHRFDAAVAAAFDAHQGRTVAGRRQLGTDAVGVTVRVFVARGAAVDVRPSPWLLRSRDADLVEAWLHGWVGAAAEQRPDLAFDGYLAERLAAARAGRLRVAVHHADLLARWPEPVPEQHDVIDRPHLDELAAPGAGREPSRAGEPRPARSAEEERRHHDVQLVDEPRREERRVDGGTALDEQLPDAPPGQVGEQAGEQVGEPGGSAGVDDVRQPAEPAPEGADRRRGGVHEPLGVAGGEEGGGRVEVARPGDGDLGRVRRQAAGDAPLPALVGPHEQARVVRPDRPRSHEDRVARRADRVDPVEVRRRGQDEPARRGVVEVPVDRGRAAQHDEGPVLSAQSDHTGDRSREEVAPAARLHSIHRS